jgi:hypothetical protein
MVRKVKAFLVTLCLLFAVDAKALTGNQWKELSQVTQGYYVMGVIDGWRYVGAAALAIKERNTSTELIKCVMKIPYSQTIGIVQKYMQDNPAIWHYSMEELIWLAAVGACDAMSK